MNPVGSWPSRCRPDGNFIPLSDQHAIRIASSRKVSCALADCGKPRSVGFHFYGMDEIGEFDGILDAEDRDVVADQVPVAFLGVELDGKPANITRSVDRTGATCDGR